MSEVAFEIPAEPDVPSAPEVSEESTTATKSSKRRRNRNRSKPVTKAVSETPEAKLPQKKKLAQKKKTAQSSESLHGNLSSEALAFIATIQQRSSEKKKGHLTVEDLMASAADACAQGSILDRLLEPSNPLTVLTQARQERPPVPGFPGGLDTLSHGVRPELLMKAMELFQNTEGDHRQGGHSPPSRRRPSHDSRPFARQSNERLPPWIPLSPMYPLEDRYLSQQRMNQNGPRRYDQPQKSFSSHGRHDQSNHGPNGTAGHSKARKPYFMPYMSGTMVTRGLSAQTLIKGALRVNQRNYEESYIDNPEGDDHLDLLIHGLQDRNRALHGDIVVVRIKPRKEWVVRDNLYQAWRNGELKVDRDDDGKPLTVPPVPIPKDDGVVELALGGTAEVKIQKDELSKSVPVHDDAKYDRSEMILMGAQAEINRRHAGGDQLPTNAILAANIEEMISNLSIKRIELQDPALATPSKKVPPKKANGQKKGALRYLSDMPDEDWGMPDCCLQKTAEVVFVLEAKNCRAAMGQLKVMGDMNKSWALFSPTDSRMPRMMIPGDQLPVGFFDRPQDFAKFVFVARLVEWQATNQFARGRLERSLGVAGDPEVETEGILFANNVDSREFPPSALQSLPDTATAGWTIPAEELARRRDFREENVFTIDPKTARDLDDALHIKPCDDVDGAGKPGWEIGVHIADVTYFLQQETELDEWANQRATSVYLVHKVVPMLPRILCEELCSLNPGVDRLTFSVIWKMDDEANVYSTEFVRSVIRSKVKLAYEHAQDFIEHPNKEFAINEVPEVFDDVSVHQIKEKVLQLNDIALKLRAQRSANGALRLDQPKMKFALDDTTKMPMGVTIYEIKDANRLVEEYMLLANMAVARKIEEAYPSTALLRRHPSPKQKVMREVVEICEKIGFPLDATSSGMLSSSLNKYMGDSSLMRSINQVLSMLMMKPMQLAQYFCVGTVDSKSEYSHYALSCPFYTHFTSPIRRYPDVLVHRFLAASLGYADQPRMSIQEIQKCAEHCNDKKAAAKTCSEGSDETFFGLFVKSCGPLAERGVVVNVLDAAFDVLVFKYGVIKRVYVNKLNMARDPIFVEESPSKLILFWNNQGSVIEQPIQMCTVVNVELFAEASNEASCKYQAVIKPASAAETRTLHQLWSKGEELESDGPCADPHPLGDLNND